MENIGFEKDRKNIILKINEIKKNSRNIIEKINFRVSYKIDDMQREYILSKVKVKE